MVSIKGDQDTSLALLHHLHPENMSKTDTRSASHPDLFPGPEHWTYFYYNDLTGDIRFFKLSKPDPTGITLYSMCLLDPTCDLMSDLMSDLSLRNKCVFTSCK